MQLDTEDGETFVPPAGVVASPTIDQPESTNGRTPNPHDDEDGVRAHVDQDVPA